MKKIIVSVALISLFHSCKKEEKVAGKPEEEIKVNNTQTSFPLPPVFLDASKSEDEILDHIQHRKSEIISILNGSSPQKNDLIYEHYKKENDSALALLTLKRTNLLDDFFQFNQYNPDTETTTLKVPEKYKKLVNRYTQTGIEFWDVGEAYTELRMFPDFYYAIFNGKLTADYQNYLNMITEEDKVLFQSDAAISIPWKDVAKRVEVREKFLQEFPASQLKTKVHEELQRYRYAYLLGSDNSSTQNDEGGFTPENLQEYHRFIKENPKSETTEIIKQLISMPEDREKVYYFVNEWLHYPYGRPLD
ncbi:hypothetical protein VUJ46_02085 [Chryseobacterium sp. MYb264]|uniref:hypothetical protein n=1 Tax=Chryseobacterium sp. MYb264 TaxID=2745153 RepID=UPI002E0E36CB|nr:hypothetical protein VUJ46_02085 [Chryseobacterium sp. MYb264]